MASPQPESSSVKCQGLPGLADKCFTVHGRLYVSNGTLSVRLLKIGTKRIFGASAEGEGKGRTLTIRLKYGDAREPSISGLRRISKPGQRVYADKAEVPRVLGGLGIAILSTSQGVLTDRQARKLGVGGEVLAYVW